MCYSAWNARVGSPSDRTWCCNKINWSLVLAALGVSQAEFLLARDDEEGVFLELPALNCWGVLELALAVPELKSLWEEALSWWLSL